MGIARLLAAILVTVVLGVDYSPDRFGIGATLVQPKDSTFIEIRYCAPLGPASQAGLLAGDRLLGLDDHSIKGWPFDRVLGYLIRDDAAPVRVTVLRAGRELSFQVRRMRLSEIAAGQNLRMEWDPRFNAYRLVPLEERRELTRGDVVPLDSLLHVGCRISPVAPEDTSTVMYFWASWCGPCKTLMDRIQELHGNVRLVAVNIDSSCATFASALAKRDPPGADRWAGGPHGPLCQSLRVYRRGIPTAALLGPKNHFVRVVTGVDSIVAMIEYEPPSYLLPKFWLAAEEVDMPADVLISVAYAQSHWGHWGFPREDGTCGIMGLRVEKGSTVDEASRFFVNTPRERIMHDLETNIRAGATLLRHDFIAVHGDSATAERMQIIDNWRPVLARFTRYPDASLNDLVFQQFAACAKGRGFGR